MQAALFMLGLALPMFGSLDVKHSFLKHTQPNYHAVTYKTLPRKLAIHFVPFLFWKKKHCKNHCLGELHIDFYFYAS